MNQKERDQLCKLMDALSIPGPLKRADAMMLSAECTKLRATISSCRNAIMHIACDESEDLSEVLDEMKEVWHEEEGD